MPPQSSKKEVDELRKRLDDQQELLDSYERQSGRLRGRLRGFCKTLEVVFSLLLLTAIGGFFLFIIGMIAEGDAEVLFPLVVLFFCFGVLWSLLLVIVSMFHLKVLNAQDSSEEDDLEDSSSETKVDAAKAQEGSDTEGAKEQSQNEKEDKEDTKEPEEKPEEEKSSHAARIKSMIPRKLKPKGDKEDKQATDYEAIFGGSWLSKTGMAIIVLGVAFFLQFSFTNGWITPPFQILIGVLIGAGLLLGGEWSDRKGHHAFARALTGGGSLILYLSFFAANVIYTVVPDYYIALLLCLITTIITFGLASRYRSVVVAFFGLVGVYAIPLILSYDGESAVLSVSKVFLLAYYTFINLGLALWLTKTPSIFISVSYLIGAYAMPLFIGLRLELLYVLFAYYVILNSLFAYLSHSNGWWGLSYGVLIMGFIIPSLGLASLDTTAWLYLVYAGTVMLTYLVLFSLHGWGQYMIAPFVIAISTVPFIFFGSYAITPAYAFIITTLLAATIAAAIKPSRTLFYVMVLWAIVIPRMMIPENSLDTDIVYTTFLACVSFSFIIFSIIRRWEYVELMSMLLTYPILAFIVDADYQGFSWSFLGLFFALYLGAQLYRIITYKTTSTSDVVTVVANGIAFAGIGAYLLAPYHEHLQGLFIGALAVLHFVVGYTLWHQRPSGEVDRKGITTYLALSIGFLLIMFPVQFDGVTVVLLWAASGLVLLLTGLRIQHVALRIIGGILFLFSLARFFLYDFFRFDSDVPFVTPRSLTFLTLVIFTGIISYLYRSPPTRVETYNARIVALFALFLTWGYISYEAFMLFHHASDLAALLSLTLVWALYAMVLITVGFVKDAQWLRLASLLVFGITILKLFLLDVWLLGLAFRILAFIGLGILLLITSFMYSRFKMLIIGGKDD